MRLPDDPIRRRRLAALACAAAAAAAGGMAVGAGAGDEPRRAAPSAAVPAAGTGAAPEEPLPERPSGAQLQREAGQTIVLRFFGTSPPAYVLRALRERRAAGVILFADNVRSPGRLRAMTRALHRAAGGRTLVMVDQEGGAVRRIRFAEPRTAAARIATPEAAAAVGRATARDLRGLGITTNLAPVADVGSWPRSIMRDRAFPGDAAQVGRLVAATVRAYEDGGLHATVKHFPGFGRSTANTDFARSTVAGRGDLEPYRAAIAAGVPLVMASHALHPELDRTRIASQSRRIMTGMLRDELGFEGACVTDSLEAKAVVTRVEVDVAALRSMRAGCDLLLTTGPGSYLRVLRRLVATTRRDPGLRGRLREARARIRPLLR